MQRGPVMFANKSKSFIKEVIRDIDKIALQRRKLASAHLVKVMKEKADKQGPSLPGQPPAKDEGNLKKGIGSKHLEDVSLVGYGPPAHHGHLMELGTKERRTKTGIGSGPRGSGHVEPRPLIFPTFEEESGAVEEIMSKQWM
jgi:hypothetical protein